MKQCPADTALPLMITKVGDVDLCFWCQTILVCILPAIYGVHSSAIAKAMVQNVILMGVLPHEQLFG